MSKIKEFLADLPEEKNSLFVPVFDNIDRFYTIVYLVALNEHTTEMDKPDSYEQRLEAIRYIRRRIEELVDSYGLDGKEIVADIASDYFEDYVNYQQPEFDLDNDEFLAVIRKISQS